ncbi:MAG: hypothetical protein AAB267_07375 [Candidatus Desantisbacteria bacterium]
MKEVRSQKSEVRSQKSEGRREKGEGRRQTRKNYIVCILYSVFCILLFAGSGYGICLNDLLLEPKRYDGQKIEVSGEVIGFSIKKENGWFINVDIGGGVIGVFTKELPRIEHYGQYKEKGDVVRVKGVFYSTCQEHRGETDIHSQSIEVIARGETIPHPIKKANVISAILLSFLAIALVLLYKRFSGKSA